MENERIGAGPASMPCVGPANLKPYDNNNCLLSNGSYINFTEKTVAKVLELVHDQPDLTNGEIAAACDLDYQECKTLLDKLEYEGYIRIIMRRHYYAHDRRPEI